MNRLKYILIALAVALSVIQQPAAGREIKDFFIEMPDELMPMLDRETRKDLVDICLSGMHTALPNKWQSTSTMAVVSKNFLSLYEDGEYRSQTSMALLYGAKDTTICIVRSIFSNADAESAIYFFDRNWRSLKGEKYILLPELSEFERGGERVIDDAQPIESLRIGIGVDGERSAHVEISTKTSDRKISYDWNGKRFVRRTE